MEEKEYLDRIQREIEEEKLRSRNRKIKENNDRIKLYEVYQEKKKKEDEEKWKEKQKERDLVTLDFRSDENMKSFKEYMVRLNDNVDNNMQKHKQFMQVNDKKPEINYPNYNNMNPSNMSPQPRVFHNEEPNIPVEIRKSPSRSPIKHFEESYSPNYVNSNRSDVTFADYFSKKQNQEYLDYRQAQKVFLNYNKEIIENKEKKKQVELDIKSKNREVMLKEVN